jgi:hypothetical protein
MVYRADERVDAARAGFVLLGKADRRDPVRFSRFLTECRVNPSLNWQLTADTQKRIHDDVKRNLTLAAVATNILRDVTDETPPELAGDAALGQPRVEGRRPATREVIQNTAEYRKASPAARQAMESTAGFTAQFGAYAAPPKVEALPPAKK